ncbi:MAG: hypothetical protein GC178_12885 [Flavobacteriales bacterium]|nr:hypothetical protein [Flavobacteriales bacterium]
MKLSKLVDLMLDELVTTMQPSLSIRRVLNRHKIDFDDDLINEIDSILRSKSLVDEKDTDSQGYPCYSLTNTGQDFIRTFGTYSNYLKGLEVEQKRVEKARNKKPYVAKPGKDGSSPTPFQLGEESFFEKNKFGLLFLLLVFISFLIVLKIT